MQFTTGSRNVQQAGQVHRSSQTGITPAEIQPPKLDRKLFHLGGLLIADWISCFVLQLMGA